MKTLLKLFVCLLIVSCSNNNDIEYVDLIEEARREFRDDLDSMINAQERMDSIYCNETLPTDVELMINALGEITLKKGSHYIERRYDYNLNEEYKWGTYTIWFKDTCSAKKAYKILLQIQRDQAKKDSISHLRNQIKLLKGE